MKTILFTTVCLILFSFTSMPRGAEINKESTSHSHYNEAKKQTVVYICNGPGSYAYHSHARCSGLNNCSTQIYSIYLSDAINRRRSPCQRCY